MLERMLQRGQDWYNRKRDALQQEIQSLREQQQRASTPEQVAELERVLDEKRTLLEQTHRQWDEVREKRERL